MNRNFRKYLLLAALAFCQVFSVYAVDKVIKQSCADGSTLLTAPDGSSMYEWYIGGSNVKLADGKTFTVNPTQTKIYSCKVDFGLKQEFIYVMVFPNEVTLPDMYIKQGESVQIGGETFTTEGLHTVVIPRGDGRCDSTVHVTIHFQDPVPAPTGCVDFSQLGNRDVLRCYNYGFKITGYKGGSITSPQYGLGDTIEQTISKHPRQRLMTDDSKTDDRIAALPVKPQGAQYSIMCGSEGYGSNDSLAKGSLTFMYLTIDQSNPIIMLNYAAVVQRSAHEAESHSRSNFKTYVQPNFDIFLAERATGITIPLPNVAVYPYTDPSCVAGGKWQTATGLDGKSYYWKDWDSIYVDFSSYIGKEIVIIVSTLDCSIEQANADGSKISICKNTEISRVYLSVNCAPKEIVQQCQATGVQLTAPDGFKYQWYKESKTTGKLVGETSQTLTVDYPAMDSDTMYICELINLIDNTVVSDVSTIVYSNAHELSPVVIDFGDEYDFYGDKLTASGTYHKVVPSQPTWLGCDSVEYIELYVNPSEELTMECSGNDFILHAPDGYDTYQWMDDMLNPIAGETGKDFTVANPGSDVSVRYVCHMEDIHGSVVEADAVVWSNIHAISATIDEGQEYDFFGEKKSVSGLYEHILPGQSYLGCDSIIRLNLVVKKAAGDECFDMSTIEGEHVTLYNVDFGDAGTGSVHEYRWKDPVLAPYNHPRHTLMTTPGTDNLCPQLDVLPPGKNTSYRLASDAYTSPSDMARGTNLDFSYVIDADAPIILLSYACALDAPNHPISVTQNASANPWMELTIEIEGVGTDQLFLHNPQVAGGVTGDDWHSFINADAHTIYWKDWRTIGLDMSNFIGQKLIVHLYQRDCALSDYKASPFEIKYCTEHHQSHLYAHLDCAAKAITQTCSESNITLTAPDGFKYQWYLGADTTGTLIPGETGQQLVVDIPSTDQNQQYSCKLISYREGAGSKQVSAVVYSNTHDLGQVATLYFGETYDYHGEELIATKDSTYTMNLTAITGETTYLGCDSIETLFIKVDASCEGLVRLQKDSLCADADSIVFICQFSVGKPDSYDLTFSEEAKSAGFVNRSNVALTGDTAFVVLLKHDSVHTTNAAGKPLNYVGYQRPGTYSVRVTTHTDCHTDIEDTLSFTLLYPSSIITQRWSDVLIVNNEYYNGGYRFSSIRWFQEGVGEIAARGDNDAYLADLTVGGEYWAELVREGESQSFCTCHKTVEAASNTTKFPAASVSIVRRVASTRQFDIQTNIEGTYIVYDMCGRPVQNGLFGENINLMIDLRNAPGNMFLVRFVGNEGTQETKKVIVY